jgi:hypothetical protein
MPHSYDIMPLLSLLLLLLLLWEGCRMSSP